jgi:hypothetical protein
MKNVNVMTSVLIAVPLLFTSLAFGQSANPSSSVQQALIALDKQWGEAGRKGDTATLNKILSDKLPGASVKREKPLASRSRSPLQPHPAPVCKTHPTLLTTTNLKR